MKLFPSLEWKSLGKAEIRLGGLPTNISCLDIWRSLCHYGTIANITILALNNQTHKRAFVLFTSPPPDKPFWESGKLTVVVSGEAQEVNVFPPSQPRHELHKIRSPSKSGVYYNQSTLLRAVNMDFGFLSNHNTMDIMRTIHHRNWSPTINIDLQFKRIEITAACFVPDPRREDHNIKVENDEPIGGRENHARPISYKAEIQFSHLPKLFYIPIDDEHWTLVIHLQHPPKFYKLLEDIQESFIGQHKWSERDAWVRIGDAEYATDWYKQDPISNRRRHQFIEIGKWTTYRLLFHSSRKSEWDPITRALQDFNIKVVPVNPTEFSVRQGVESEFWNMLETPKLHKHTSQLDLLDSAREIHLPFDVRYQLEAAISQGIFTEQSITFKFLKELEKLNGERGTYINKAKTILEYATDRGKRIYNPMSLLDDRRAHSYYKPVVLPRHCAWVRKIVVTPSKVYLNTPVPETTNRVLRQYATNIDRFIRVQFMDERLEGKLYSVPSSDVNHQLFNRVFRTLQNGILVGGRRYQFLAFGNSQFREHGAYFFCPTDHQSCDDIRSWMGVFSHIKVVAKYASRLGQCFSTTRDPRGLAMALTIKDIPDITRGAWCFSDGVGMISSWMAAEITQHLNLYQNGRVPSAFQFRLGGYKGILVTWPQARFNEVCLRPSQKKFTASSKNIEIIRPSRFSVATLNRQTIAILSCLGVSRGTFLEMARSQLSAYEKAMTDPQLALQLLQRSIDENGITTTIAQLIHDGFMTSQEPFVVAILQLWRAWSMKLLREKARIVVEKGAFVLGCVDETYTLRGHTGVEKSDLTQDSGRLPQIFLQVPTSDQPDQYEVITGLCIVGRNPCIHPGDIRVVEAVDVDVAELKALRDVVVFPATGDRDISSMCSGGDLDGDDYFVFWDPRLIPKEWNYPPMVHDTITPEVLDRNVSITDITSFFVEYVKNDSLGTIAHAHVAWSDQLADGPKAPICIELAQLHSNAVDYVKTGQKAHMALSQKPKKWPHFMQKNPKNSYVSRSALGQLYDMVSEIRFIPDFEKPFSQKILRRYNLSNETLAKAREIKSQYDVSIRRIMSQWDIKTEFEVWTTFMMSRPKIGTDYKVQEDLGVIMMGLRERFVDACREASGTTKDGLEEDEKIKLLLVFVAATYRIMWEEVQIALQEIQQTRMITGRIIHKRSKEDMPFISFPWLFGQELGQIVCDAEAMMELDQVPIPTIVQVTNIQDAMSLITASYGYNRLFHRGNEISIVGHNIDDVGGDYDSIDNTTSMISTLGEEEDIIETVGSEPWEGVRIADAKSPVKQVEAGGMKSDESEIEITIQRVPTGLDILQKLAMTLEDSD
ncbi:RNA dependent RNA polymerase-domain-containing protein [Xylariales sp. PMI_506]|nr:RNA dependent RNA polymerase-domain-containing protein [Xylariales sp. PMI_506]